MNGFIFGSTMPILFMAMCAFIGTWMFAIAADRKNRALSAKKAGYQIGALLNWGLCLFILMQLHSTSKAVFIWIGIVSLAATITVFIRASWSHHRKQIRSVKQ